MAWLLRAMVLCDLTALACIGLWAFEVLPAWCAAVPWLVALPLSVLLRLRLVRLAGELVTVANGAATLAKVNGSPYTVGARRKAVAEIVAALRRAGVVDNAGAHHT